jgi:hypothetical protein
MILALILSTRNQLSEPEPSIIDTRTVLTPLARRHFPSAEFRMARTRVFRNKVKFDAGVPTLVELLLHKMATNPVAFVPELRAEKYATIQDDVDNLEQYTGPRKDNIPFYIDYQGEPTDNERATKRSGSTASGPRILYLTSATLIVGMSAIIFECKTNSLQFLKICSFSGRKKFPSTARTRFVYISSRTIPRCPQPEHLHPNLMFVSSLLIPPPTNFQQIILITYPRLCFLTIRLTTQLKINCRLHQGRQEPGQYRVASMHMRRVRQCPSAEMRMQASSMLPTAANPLEAACD